MSSSQRPLNRVFQLVLSQFMHMCRELGPNGVEILHEADLTVDPNHRTQGTVAKIHWKGKLLWGVELPFNADKIEFMQENSLRKEITSVMQASLNVAAQMWRVKLERQFPNSIKDVLLEYREDVREKQLIVIFKNGHKAIGLESVANNSKSEFLARCAMLYDLPEIREDVVHS